MKQLISNLIIVGAAGLQVGAAAVPVPQDNASLSQFIASHNIFDPARPHDGHTSPILHPASPDSAPGIQFVGTMSYEKGLFAFFNGDRVGLSRVARIGDRVAGYTVAGITAKSVRLAAGKTEILLNAGDDLRQENNQWVLARAGELPASSSGLAVTGSASDNTSSIPAGTSSALEQNNDLKRLMQQREKENQ